MIKTLVFIHGWASVPEIWQGQREYFARDYEVILPDIGPAKDITGAANIVNDSIKGKKDIALIGWSLGWLVVLEALKSFALKPKGVVAVNSTPKFCSDEYLGAGFTQTHLNKMIRDCKRDPKKTVDNFYRGLLTEEAKDMLGEFNIRNLNYQSLMHGLYMLRDYDCRDFLGEIKLPALIIAGAKDKICPPEASEYMYKRINDSQLKVFDCGHIPFIDKAEGFNSTVDDFIKSVGYHYHLDCVAIS